jgi:AsmA protein
MRRLIIGFGAFLFLVVTIALVVPFFLPKDAIKERVVAIVEQQLGWRLRLDGPVSLALLPGFSLTAEDIGLSGEAGADGIEFARADAIEFGLAWEGLFGGAIQVTRINLDTPNILLEIGPDGLTSWEPRRRLGGQPEADPADTEASPAQNEPASEDAAGSAADKLGPLQRIGVDRFSIANGVVLYSDLQTGDRFNIEGLNLVVTAPDLSGEVTVEGELDWNGTPVALAGSLTGPLAFAGGEQVPLAIGVSTGENRISIEGSAGMEPLRMDLAFSASGPSVSGLAAVAGDPLPRDPGAFSVSAKFSGDEASMALSDLSATVGSFVIDGSLDADLAGASPDLSGRFVLDQGSLADLLALAGQDFNASGTLGADLAFSASGADVPSLLATLDLTGSASLSSGVVSGLGLASAVGGDPAADSIKDIGLKLNISGLDGPLSLSGAMSWRGEGFTIMGKATPAPLLGGMAAPVNAQIKGGRFSAGFDGRATASGNLEGAVSLETADLRTLLAWMGQPVEAGNGLKNFKVSGLFTVEENAIGFDETNFRLDGTSGRANGKVSLGAIPTITAKLDLGTLLLDPYLESGGGGSAGSGSAGGASSSSGGGAASSSGWSDAPIDFSGLKAVNADLAISAKEIHWKEIRIGKSILTAAIKNGVLDAELKELNLYEGKADGRIVLNGSSGTPSVKANFDLADLDAHPALRDAVNTRWLEGRAYMALDISASGASQRQLVQNLNGTARFEFADGAIRRINIPKMVRGLSVETFLGWQDASEEKTDFSSLSASMAISNGIAQTDDLSLIGPLVRITGGGTTNMPERTLDWKVDPKIVASLEGQAAPRPKGTDKKMAGLGVPIIISGSWDNPKIYPDIAGILENPAAAYKQLENMGGDLVKILKQKPDEAISNVANEAIKRATGGNTQIDVQKVIEGKVDDKEVLKAVEEGFGLPSGLLGTFGGKKKQE